MNFATAPTITTRPSRYGFDETEFETLKEEVKKGKLSNLKKQITAFSLPIKHSFLVEDPILAAKLSNLILKKANKGKLSPIKCEKKISSCVRQFQIHQVYLHGIPTEKVKLVCKDGEVRINKELLCYQSSYFLKMLSCQMKEKKNEDGEQLIDFSYAFDSFTVNILKKWLYEGKWTELDKNLGILSLKRAGNAACFAHMIEWSVGFEKYNQKTKTLLLEYQIQNDQELEKALRIAHHLIPLDEEYRDICFSLLEKKLGCTVEKIKVPHTDFFVISIDQLALLCVEERTRQVPTYEESSVKRYIEKLPHVEYKAVGINFSCLLEIDHPEQKIKSQYLKLGPWNDNRMNPKALGLRLVYNVFEADLRFSIYSGTAGKKRGILIDANYHTRTSQPNDLHQIIRIISLYPDRCRHFRESLYRILDEDNLL